MTKKSEAQRQAEARYNATKNRALAARFFFDEIEDIDAARGEMTRNAWIRQVVLEAIKQSKQT